MCACITGISAEPLAPGRKPEVAKLTKHPKDLRYDTITKRFVYSVLIYCACRSKELIIKAINGNDFLKNLEKVQINEIVDCMYIRDFAADQYICREGGVGTQLYVLAGTFSCLFRPLHTYQLVCLGSRSAHFISHVGPEV